ncbi:hypothetical protein DID88_005565 [Monilinia fructigena]|uniref:Uncharacterized protein n=1 Tax=Monilinia fructigena TaxID=38457 RepID=A0A395J2J2_9HELO|nr:hypothetical protein DID88_005565 [Monilinia fructigena]
MTRHPPEEGSQYPVPIGPSDNTRFPPYSSPSATSHYPELHRTPSNNGPQYSLHATAPVQDSRYPQPGYNVPPPGYPYNDVRGYQPLSPYKPPSPPKPTMTFKQNAPRQRTQSHANIAEDARFGARASMLTVQREDVRIVNASNKTAIFTPVPHNRHLFLSRPSTQQMVETLWAKYAALWCPWATPSNELICCRSNHMFQSPQSSFEPQLPPNPQQLPQPPQPPHPPHPLNLPSLSRSPYDQNTTLPSPTGSLDSQRHKRPTDEQHYGRLPPPAPGSSSTYHEKRTWWDPGKSLKTNDIVPLYHCHLAMPRNYGYQRGENNVDTPTH